MNKLKTLAVAISAMFVTSTQASSNLGEIFYPTDDQAHIEQAYQMMVKTSQVQALKQELALKDQVSQMVGNMKASQTITPAEFQAFNETLAAHQQKIQTLNLEIKELKKTMLKQEPNHSLSDYAQIQQRMCQASQANAIEALGDASDPSSLVARHEVYMAKQQALSDAMQVAAYRSARWRELRHQMHNLNRTQDHSYMFAQGQFEFAEQCLNQ